MDTEKKTTIEQDPEGLVRFSKPYHFEGQDYTEIDLSGMEDLTAKDMIAAEKYLFKSGVISPLPDQTAEYICFIAGRVPTSRWSFSRASPRKTSTE